MSDEPLTTAQTARALGLSRERVIELNNLGRLFAVRTPLGRLFPAEEVERERQARAERAAAKGAR